MRFPQDYNLSKNLTITLDWFEMSGTTNNYLLTKVNKLSFEKKESYKVEYDNEITTIWEVTGTTRYSTRWKVYVGTLSFATVFCNPFNTTLVEKNRFNIQVNNEWLYTCDWISQYITIVKTLELNLTNISRLDIAVDGANDLLWFLSKFMNQEQKKVIKVGQGSINREYLSNDLTELKMHMEQLQQKIELLEKQESKKGESKFNKFARGIKYKNMVYDTIVLGSRKSDKYITVYHKSKELQKSHKIYIQKFWAQNGIGSMYLDQNQNPVFQDQDNIVRCEVRMSNKYLEYYPELVNDLTVLNDPEKISTLFFAAIFKNLDFRHNTDSNISRCQQIELIPRNVFKTTYLTKVKIPVRDHLFAAKVGVKSAIMQVLKNHAMDKKEQYKEYVRQTLDNYELHDWYKKRLPIWQTQVKVELQTGHIYELETL